MQLPREKRLTGHTWVHLVTETTMIHATSVPYRAWKEDCAVGCFGAPSSHASEVLTFEHSANQETREQISR